MAMIFKQQWLFLKNNNQKKVHIKKGRKNKFCLKNFKWLGQVWLIKNGIGDHYFKFFFFFKRKRFRESLLSNQAVH